ncbi:hypothetical protein THAOC_28174 [Thalassiosira oceanica]|uniref:Uncharacterized protein n=1 Tax=Thalassiosira oceanica TaxID=159749 RepID=K0RUJ0_THAOC|nr:hypothetical protein THAOC_28174 [Thalassiosira oceanica]|eukprot:EJK52536.1 hypothetical protein THAOC_28174 [Thalassiosira oceanica]
MATLLDRAMGCPVGVVCLVATNAISIVFCLLRHWGPTQYRTVCCRLLLEVLGGSTRNLTAIGTTANRARSGELAVLPLEFGAQIFAKKSKGNWFGPTLTEPRAPQMTWFWNWSDAIVREWIRQLFYEGREEETEISDILAKPINTLSRGLIDRDLVLDDLVPGGREGAERKAQYYAAAAANARALEVEFTAYGETLERVEVFKYLGRLMAMDDNDICMRSVIISKRPGGSGRGFRSFCI